MYRPQRATRLSSSVWQRAALKGRYERDETDYSEESEHEYDEKAYHELYDPEQLTFKLGQSVWIRLQETWYRGQVRRILQTEQSKGRNLRYDVHFRHWNSATNMKACFDPLNGNIKPDSPRIRALLHRAGAPVGSADKA